MKRIAASFVFPLGGREPIRNGFVEYADDGTIAVVGKCENPGNESEFLSGQAIVPGFVNAHCHVELSYMKGLFKKGTGMAGFIDQINALRDTKSIEERKRDIVYWMDMMWSRGVQAMADISNCADSFDIKQKSPMYTRTFLEVFGTEPEDSAEVIRNVLQLQSIASGFGIDAAPTPHACYTMSPQLLTAVSREGLKSGFLSYHSEETPEEEDMLKYGRGKMWDNRKAAGMSVPPVTGKSSLLYFIDRLKEAHPAPFNEHILLVHEVCMDQEGIDAVKAVMTHPYIALCPCSNIFIHNALPPVELMRRNGLKLTIGTDSLSSNDDLDIVREMRCLQDHFEGLDLNELLTWACQNGAEFLGNEGEVGTLESGKKPGLVAIGNISENASLTSESASNRII
jgi:cytosine/adenosine deaminase-related metal-dependent hydrolase